MVIRILTIVLLSFLVNSCWFFGISCKDDESAVRKEVNVPDLFSISPLKESYAKEEIITFSSYLYSSELYYEEYFWGIDLKPHSLLSVANLILENEFDIVKGFINEFGQVYSEYNAEEDSYELEIKIKLLRTGQYSIYGHEPIRFKGKRKCDFYHINTNIAGIDEDGQIKFYVEE